MFVFVIRVLVIICGVWLVFIFFSFVWLIVVILEINVMSCCRLFVVRVFFICGLVMDGVVLVSCVNE